MSSRASLGDSPGTVLRSRWPQLRTDQAQVVVVGGGAAGLHVASRRGRGGRRVILVSRKPLQESASFWAQGGLAAALAADDSPERHAADTLAAGRGLCRPPRSRSLADEAPGGRRVAR